MLKQLPVNTRPLVIGLVALLLSSMWCSLGFWSWQERERTLAATELELEQLTSAVEEQTKGLFKQAETSLVVANHWIAAHPDVDPANALEFIELVEKLRSTSEGLVDLRIVTRAGVLRYVPDHGQAKSTDVSDRDYFAAQNDPKTRGYFIARPVLSRVTSKWGIPISVPAETPRADTAVLFVAIELDRIAATFESERLKPNGSIAIMREDGTVLFRSPFDGTGVGNAISMGAAWKKSLADAPKETFISRENPFDGASRIVAISGVSGYPLVVAATASTDDILSPWQHHTAILLMVALVASVCFLQFAKVLTGALKSEAGARLALEKNVIQLANSDAVQRSLLENLHTGIIVHGPDTQIVFSNMRSCELLGLTQDQMLGKTAIDPAWCFVDAAGRRLLPEEFPVARVIATLRPTGEMMMGVKTPAREELTWLLGSAFPEFDEAGTLKHVVVNFHDITRMREADERWRFALEGSGDGVWDLNLQTGEAVYSRRYQEMLGYAEGELPSNHEAWSSRVHVDDMARIQAVIGSYMANPQGSIAAEYRLLCKDGTYKWVYSRGMVVSRGADGKPLRMVGTHTDISGLKEAEIKVWNQANFDQLTQLPNRRLFYDRLEMQLKQAKRDDHMLALLFVDLDHFKDVNDTLGHDVGDQLLIEAARRIQLAVRECDTVARLGGDEFTVTLAEQRALSEIAVVAQKIIDALSEPFTLEASQSYVSASVGIALFPSDASSVNDLVKKADQAMYAAKSAGRKGFQYFTQAMHDTAIVRMGLVSDLRHALGAGEFEVHYQPIVNFKNSAILKAEALVRWRHPSRGLVPPAEFIPIAEEIGAIHEIGDWVFLQATAQVAKWQRLYGRDFQISVNKSPVQFAVEKQGLAHWASQLQAMGLHGKSIVVEITEGVLMDSNSRVAASLMAYRDSGMQIAIDDFGTGYSSLSYLKKFHIDYLKIDQSFVQNLTPDSADFALCEAIIVMAHKLGLQVIAEGVETAMQRDLLKQVGCDFAQGYLFSRPLTAHAFEELLSQAAAADLV